MEGTGREGRGGGREGRGGEGGQERREGIRGGGGGGGGELLCLPAIIEKKYPIHKIQHMAQHHVTLSKHFLRRTFFASRSKTCEY